MPKGRYAAREVSFLRSCCVLRVTIKRRSKGLFVPVSLNLVNSGTKDFKRFFGSCQAILRPVFVVKHGRASVPRIPVAKNKNLRFEETKVLLK